MHFARCRLSTAQDAEVFADEACEGGQGVFFFDLLGDKFQHFAILTDCVGIFEFFVRRIIDHFNFSAFIGFLDKVLGQPQSIVDELGEVELAPFSSDFVNSNLGGNLRESTRSAPLQVDDL